MTVLGYGATFEDLLLHDEPSRDVSVPVSMVQQNPTERYEDIDSVGLDCDLPKVQQRAGPPMTF